MITGVAEKAAGGGIELVVGASHASAGAVAEAKARARQREANAKEGHGHDGGDESNVVGGGSIRLRAGDADNAPDGHVFVDAGIGDVKTASTSSITSTTSVRSSLLQGSSSGSVLKARDSDGAVVIRTRGGAAERLRATSASLVLTAPVVDIDASEHLLLSSLSRARLSLGRALNCTSPSTNSSACDGKAADDDVSWLGLSPDAVDLSSSTRIMLR